MKSVSKALIFNRQTDSQQIWQLLMFQFTESDWEKNYEIFTLFDGANSCVPLFKTLSSNFRTPGSHVSAWIIKRMVSSHAPSIGRWWQHLGIIQKLSRMCAKPEKWPPQEGFLNFLSPQSVENSSNLLTSQAFFRRGKKSLWNCVFLILHPSTKNHIYCVILRSWCEMSNSWIKGFLLLRMSTKTGRPRHSRFKNYNVDFRRLL